jgi:hypothetical protein
MPTKQSVTWGIKLRNAYTLYRSIFLVRPTSASAATETMQCDDRGHVAFAFRLLRTSLGVPIRAHRVTVPQPFSLTDHPN